MSKMRRRLLAFLIGAVVAVVASALVIAIAFFVVWFFADEDVPIDPGETTIENTQLIAELQQKVDRIIVNLDKLSERQKSVAVELVPVVVTAYNPVRGQTDKTPLITASNKKVCEGMVALSRDLEKKFGFTFGDEIFLLGYGRFVFEDRMNKRWTNRVDILMMSKEKAKKFGLQASFLVVGR